jgi:cytoskeletal protein RodZ
VWRGVSYMSYLSDSIHGQVGDDHSRFSLAHLPLFVNLSKPQRTIIIGLILLLIAFFVLWVSPIVAKQPLNSSANTSTNNTKVQNNSVEPLNNSESQAAGTENTNSDSDTNPGVSNSNTNEATVSVDGQSVSASTDNSNPSANVNKTITTENGTAHVSIQSNVSTDSDTGRQRTSQSVNMHSSAKNDSNAYIILNQHSSGGSMR